MNSQFDKNARARYLSQRYKVPFRLKRLNAFPPKGNSEEIRLFAVARNESLRLPYFLDYYFNKGVDRMFIIDNDSTDDTVQICLSYDNVHVYSTKDSYTECYLWIEHILDEYGIGHWCVKPDIDEILSYPYGEELSIRQIVEFLGSNQFTAMRTFMLDMYSDKPIIETKYKPGQNPLEVLSFFDPDYRVEEHVFFDLKHWEPFNSIDFRGGVKERVFGNGNPLPYRLPKVPLFKYGKDVFVTDGMHAINGGKIADIQGVLFHSKFLSDFIHYARQEAEREQHFGKGILYKVFDRKLVLDEGLNMHYSGSKKYRNTQQLTDLGILKTSAKFEAYFQKIKKLSVL